MSRTRNRERLEKKLQERGKAKSTLSEFLTSMVSNLQEISQFAGQVQVQKENFKKATTESEAKASIEQYNASLNGLASASSAPIALPPKKESVNSDVKDNNLEAFVNNLALKLQPVRKHLKSLQKIILQTIAQSFDQDESLSTEEAFLKKTICLKMSCALELRAKIHSANIRINELIAHETPKNQKLIYNLISYIPAEEFLSSLFANNLEALYSHYKTLEDRIPDLINQVSKQLSPREKQELTELIQSTREQVTQYSESYIELEKNIRDYCAKDDEREENYLTSQKEIAENFLNQVVSHKACEKNGKLKAIAKFEQAFLLKVLNTPQYKMKSDVHFLRQLDQTLSKEELDCLFSTEVTPSEETEIETNETPQPAEVDIESKATEKEITSSESAFDYVPVYSRGAKHTKFKLPKELIEAETNDKMDRVARLSNHLQQMTFSLHETKENNMMEKMQSRALLFECMRYMEHQAEIRYRSSRGIDKKLARSLRTAIVHSHGITYTHQDVIQLAIALKNFIGDESKSHYDDLAQSTLFKAFRVHGNALLEQRETKPSPIHYALRTRSEALTYLRYSADSSLHENQRKMAEAALRMTNITGAVYAPGFGFDHDAAVKDRHFIAKRVKVEPEVTIRTYNRFEGLM